MKTLEEIEGELMSGELQILPNKMEFAPEFGPCLHMHTKNEVRMTHDHKKNVWTAELRVRCDQCGCPFQFDGQDSVVIPCKPWGEK